MDLNFDSPFDAREACRPSQETWEAWFDDLPRRPEYAVVWSGPPVNGYAGAPWRIGGYFVEPIESVLGLRPFDDALEGRIELEDGAEPVPYVFFEVEKIARMILHDSGLAFEILASPARLRASDRVVDDDEPRTLVRRAVCRGLLGHYRECTEGGLDDLRSGRDLSVETALRLVRELATGAALQTGRATLDLETLAERRGIDVVGDLSTAEDVEPHREALLESCEALAAALEEDAESALSTRPDAYDAIDEWLVERRLAGG